jgi:hypothetical protein
MRTYVALRRTRVRDGVKHLPRPKLTQDVLLVGDKLTCQELIEEAALLPINQSTDEIEVDLLVTVYDGHKSHNSQELRKNNGKRFKK